MAQSLELIVAKFKIYPYAVAAANLNLRITAFASVVVERRGGYPGFFCKHLYALGHYKKLQNIYVKDADEYVEPVVNTRKK
jgi:hypothetical protein